MKRVTGKKAFYEQAWRVVTVCWGGGGEVKDYTSHYSWVQY